MDGIHDLGGKQGFGPIPIGDDTHVFQHDWERRMWAIARAGVLHNITIDWFRHGLERMVPVDYLSYRYFQKWCANYLMILVDGGDVTMDEVLRGHVDTPTDPPPVKSLEEVLDANRNGAFSFEMDTTGPAPFAVGDQITTKTRISAGHTRLPAYARGARGTIITHHGTHPLPDKGALGLHEGEHLYTVSFDASELWGADATPGDTVTLELWESYFV